MAVRHNGDARDLLVVFTDKARVRGEPVKVFQYGKCLCMDQNTPELVMIRQVIIFYPSESIEVLLVKGYPVVARLIGFIGM
jgi:hypothetical protein